jgi:hypothetical protein
VFLAVGLFGASLVPFFLLMGARMPERLRGGTRSEAFELAALRFFQARDRARIALVAALLIAAARLDSSSPISKKGGSR